MLLRSTSPGSASPARVRALFAFTLLLALAGCGLPRPFEDNPGATALRLSVPPPSRLAVPAPANALLSDGAAEILAGAMADALVVEEVPAVAERVKPGDWRLVMTAKMQGDSVVPTYAVDNPSGHEEGSTSGAPVPAQVWADGDPAALKQAAVSAAPAVANLLTAIEAAERQADPNSLMNRPARVYVREVTGAPGDGDISLTREIKLNLPQMGEAVQDNPIGADFTVAGVVKITPVPDGQSRVEIRWGVLDAAGKEAGAVTQINQIQAGSLDHYWGDVALVVAQEAAGGIKDVILNQANPLRTNPAAAAIKLPQHPAASDTPATASAAPGAPALPSGLRSAMPAAAPATPGQPPGR
jgi:hypothetical protein